MVIVACAHCGNTRDYCCSFEHPRFLMCWKCGKYTWTKLENQQIKTGQAYSYCPGKCKIGKLDPETRAKLDDMLIQGWTYEDLIPIFPEAHLNIANFSNHKKHVHPYFRQFLLTLKQEEELIRTQTLMKHL